MKVFRCYVLGRGFISIIAKNYVIDDKNILFYDENDKLVSKFDETTTKVKTIEVFDGHRNKKKSFLG